MGEEPVHPGSSNPRLSSPSVTERKSTIKFSDNIQEQEEETPLLAPPQRPRSGSPYNDGHRNGSRVTITSPIDSKPGSPSTRPSPPTSAARSKLLYHGDGINRNVPIGFNLSRMLTSSLLNELQFARYEKFINIIVNKRGGMLPKGPHSQQQQQQQQPIKSAMKGSKDIVPQSSENAEIVARKETTKKNKMKKCQRNGTIHVPVESQGISCGLYREGEARLGWRKIHVESWEQSREWASLVAAAEKKKAVLAEITGKIATGTAASNLARRKSSLSAGLISAPTIERGLSIDYQAILNRNISSSAAASQTPKNGMYLQQTENLVKELGMYNSLSKFVSRPQLGKSKKLPGDLDFHITRAPPMGANGPNADKLYDISDFVIIMRWLICSQPDQDKK
ncbi:hypothetical protein BDR26DRAFT_875709 [Obelidium mucronatum]|nr:hypothetical protein BDR26DRAFT_875709 [Obelidium mucronatum]